MHPELVLCAHKAGYLTAACGCTWPRLTQVRAAEVAADRAKAVSQELADRASRLEAELAESRAVLERSSASLAAERARLEEELRRVGCVAQR